MVEYVGRAMNNPQVKESVVTCERFPKLSASPEPQMRHHLKPHLHDYINLRLCRHTKLQLIARLDNFDNIGTCDKEHLRIIVPVATLCTHCSRRRALRRPAQGRKRLKARERFESGREMSKSLAR